VFRHQGFGVGDFITVPIMRCASIGFNSLR